MVESIKQYARLQRLDAQTWKSNGTTPESYYAMQAWYSREQSIELYENDPNYPHCNPLGRSVRLTRAQLKLVHELEQRSMTETLLYKDEAQKLANLVDDVIKFQKSALKV